VSQLQAAVRGVQGDLAPARQLTGKIIACFFTVYNALGFGMLESVYRNARSVELARENLHAQPEVPIEVVTREERIRPCPEHR